ncbi:DUF3303 domain-containing protein [Acidobacteria bacterium AB60]|nr:DUF3303 domain-containing protein [Acidobacteria bacterium AB60]
MKFMLTYSVRPGCRPDAINRFLTTQGAPPAGVKLLGRWHNTDSSGGFALFETDDPVALFEGSAMWADVLDLNSHSVVEDPDAAAVFVKLQGK